MVKEGVLDPSVVPSLATIKVTELCKVYFYSEVKVVSYVYLVF